MWLKHTTHNIIYIGKKRNIKIRHGITKQFLKNRMISLDYEFKRNLSDSLTNGLTRK